jgi:two-component system nitrate/nitrite sensor histidine kinase NarX
MHDGLAQTLSYAKLAANQSALLIESGQEAEAVRTLDKVSEALNQAVEDTRRAIASLQEVPPLNESLQESLASLAGDQTGVEWTSHVAERVVLSQQESQQVLRVAQEALQNARKHSGCDRISLSLDEVKGEYCLTIADNGSGFDPQALAEGNGRQHFGLNIMRARAARIGGRVEISSAPGAGTRVSLYWSARSNGI